MFFKTCVNRNFVIFTGKHVLESLFNKVAVYFNLVPKETSIQVIPRKIEKLL